jgi:hypothetical protein
MAASEHDEFHLADHEDGRDPRQQRDGGEEHHGWRGAGNWTATAARSPSPVSLPLTLPGGTTMCSRIPAGVD